MKIKHTYTVEFCDGDRYIQIYPGVWVVKSTLDARISGGAITCWNHNRDPDNTGKDPEPLPYSSAGTNAATWTDKS